MSSDVQAKRVTGTGSLAVGPARIRQIHVLSGSGTPRLTISDGNVWSYSFRFRSKSF